MNVMNRNQAKALSTLVFYNFIVSIVAIYTDYMQIKISYADESCVEFVEKHCKPCKTDVTWDGTYIFAKIYN